MFTNKPNKCYQTEEGPLWHSRSVAVVGIVFAKMDSELYVLLTQRSEIMEDMPGRWCAPCGYLDWDEDLEHATAREICEETSFNIYEQKNIFKFLNFNINSDYKKNNHQNISIASAYFMKVANLPKIRTSPETSMVEWVPYHYSVLKPKDMVFGHHLLITNAWYDIENFLLKDE